MSTATRLTGTETWTIRPQRERASLASWRGHVWAVLIAVDFYLLSNPLVFEPVFGISLQRAVLVTAIGVVLSIPWLRVPRVNMLVVAFFVWGLASALWSIQPGATIATLGLYLTLAALAVVTYANVTGEVLALGFIYGGVTLTALSVYAFEARLPGAFYEALAGPVLAGVGTNQNILGYTVTLSMCGWLALTPRRLWHVLPWGAAGASLLYAVYLSGSTTAYLTAGATFATGATLLVVSVLRGRWPRKRLRVWTLILSSAVVAFVIALGFSDYGPGTFSDRLPFWRATMSVVEEQPVIGFGWGAVWAHPWLSAPPNATVDSIYAAAGGVLTHGHNSFVDIVVDLGAVGVLLMVAIVVSVVWFSTTSVALNRPDRLGHDVVKSRFAILCVVDLMVFGVTEPLLVIPVGFWALLLVTEPRQPTLRGTRGKHISAITD